MGGFIVDVDIDGAGCAPPVRIVLGVDGGKDTFGDGDGVEVADAKEVSLFVEACGGDVADGAGPGGGGHCGGGVAGEAGLRGVGS